MAVGRQEAEEEGYFYQAVEYVFDQICSFGLYVIRYVMFLCFQVQFRTKQMNNFFAYVMLNIICLYVFMFSGMLHSLIIYYEFGNKRHEILESSWKVSGRVCKINPPCGRITPPKIAKSIDLGVWYIEAEILTFGEVMLLCSLFCSRVDFIHMGNKQTHLGTLPNSSTV